MEEWKSTFRKGLAPLLSDAALDAVRMALATDDKRLIQQATTSPAPLECVQDWPCESACLIGYAGWIGEGLETVGEVSEFFARVAFEMDGRLGDPGASRHFLNWFDETPRDEMRRLLLPEIEREQGRRLAVLKMPADTLRDVYKRAVKLAGKQVAHG